MSDPSFDYEAALAACAQGDQAAFQELFRHESPRMLALAAKMLSQRTDAEELVRDSYVLIWKNAASYDPAMGPARAWIYSILRYRILQQLRRPGRPAGADDAWIDTLPDQPAAGASDAAPDEVAQRLAALDDAQRRPIMMAFYNGLTYEQIAARLAAPVAQVKTHVRAGLRALQETAQA
jgi:RNA polymerase sigma-70 factor (ECF subfamily)